MIERFLKQTCFTSEEDYKQHLKFIIPENFNFAYDVIDAWAEHPINWHFCGPVSVAKNFVSRSKT